MSFKMDRTSSLYRDSSWSMVCLLLFLAIEALGALSLEQKVEENGDSSCSGEGMCSDGVTGSCGSRCSSDENPDYSKIVCYSCSYVLKTHKAIPNSLDKSLQKVQRHKAMKDEIKDFLL